MTYSAVIACTVIVGIGLLLCALIQTYSICRVYYAEIFTKIFKRKTRQASEHNSHEFSNTRDFASSYSSMPLQPIIVGAGALLAVFSLFYDSLVGITNFSGPQWVYFSIYGMVCVQGFVEALKWYEMPMPAGMNNAVLVITLCTASLASHFVLLFNTNQLYVTVHTLLKYTLWLWAVAIVLEMLNARSTRAAMTRVFACALTGVWMIGITIIIYYPFEGANAWNPKSHDHWLIATATYIATAAVTASLLFAVSVVTYTVERQRLARSGYSLRSSSITKSLIADSFKENVSDERLDHQQLIEEATAVVSVHLPNGNESLARKRSRGKSLFVA